MQQGNNNLLQQFMRFRNGFRGDARQQVQQLLNSGKVSQAQYDNAVRIAQRLQGMFSGMG
jgi:hypothetical protein